MILQPLAVAFAPLSMTTDEKLAITTAVLFMIVAFGAFNIRRWRNNQDRAERLEETQETTIDNVEPGLTVVSGVAKPVGETMEREAQDGDCLAMRCHTVIHEVTETRNRERGEMNDTDLETRRSTSEESVPFLVEDDTGSILVSAENTPSLSLRKTDTVTEKPPKSDGVKTRDYYKYTSKIRRTYRELLPGDDVTVYGKAVDAADYESEEGRESGTEMVLTEDDETGDFTVTHHDKEHLINRNSSNYLLIVGILVVVVGVGVLGYVWVIM